jgi:hypothetical protein
MGACCSKQNGQERIYVEKVRTVTLPLPICLCTSHSTVRKKRCILRQTKINKATLTGTGPEYDKFFTISQKLGLPKKQLILAFGCADV